MAAIKESIALDKKHQSKFQRKVSKLKEAEPPKEIIPKKPGDERGIIYIGHIPHGFYENEMRKYFSQFGDVLNVRVNRSKERGKSKGYGFIEFDDVEVAKVAADTMHNYLMFKRRLIVQYVPLERQRKNLFKGIPWNERRHPTNRQRALQITSKNTDWSEKKHLQKCEKYLLSIKKRMAALKKLGINHTFEPVDVPDNLEQRLAKLSKDTQDKKKKKKAAAAVKSNANKAEEKLSCSELEESISESDDDDDESAIEDEKPNFVRINKPEKNVVKSKVLKSVNKKKGTLLQNGKPMKVLISTDLKSIKKTKSTLSAEKESKVEGNKTKKDLRSTDLKAIKKKKGALLIGKENKVKANKLKIAAKLMMDSSPLKPMKKGTKVKSLQKKGSLVKRLK